MQVSSVSLSKPDWEQIAISQRYKGYTEVKLREKGEKEAEAKPRLNTLERGVFSGRPLEVLSQVGGNLFKALPAISATGGLWSTKCGRWSTLAALTCAV